MKLAPKYDRRLFLKGLGVGGALLPLLETEWAKAGCVPAPPRRFMAFVYTNGATNSKYWPTTTGANYTLNEVTALLAPVKDKITFVDGMQFKNAMESPNNVSGHHDLPVVLTGVPLLEHVHNRSIAVAGGPSIENYIVDQIRLSKPQESRPLVIAYKPEREPQTSWRGARAPESAQTDLHKVFGSLFVGGAPVPTISPGDLAKLRAARKSMLDVVGRDVERFCKNLGKDDRDRCNGHLTSFREIERTFGMSDQVSPGVVKTGVCAPPTPQEAFSSSNTADMGKYMDGMVKLVTAAFASNRTRCINFTFGDGIGDAMSYPHLGLPRVNGVSIYEGGSGVDHGEAHANTKTHFESRKWLFGQLAALVKSMSAVMEDNGRSLLDNTVIYMVSNMSTGGSHDVGRGLSLPTLYAGGCGGYLKTGVAIKLGARVPHNRLFHAFMNAMGVNAMGFDNARYGTELTEVRA